MAGSETFLLVDGENIDATLGGSLLGRRPAPEERPRWDRVLDYARAIWEQPARGLFFLNATASVPLSFVQALTSIGFRPCSTRSKGPWSESLRRDCRAPRQVRGFPARKSSRRVARVPVLDRRRRCNHLRADQPPVGLPSAEFVDSRLVEAHQRS